LFNARHQILDFFDGLELLGLEDPLSYLVASSLELLYINGFAHYFWRHTGLFIFSLTQSVAYSHQRFTQVVFAQPLARVMYSWVIGSQTHTPNFVKGTGFH
jgi:hypothetical protein